MFGLGYGMGKDGGLYFWSFLVFVAHHFDEPLFSLCHGKIMGWVPAMIVIVADMYICNNHKG